MKWKIHIVPHTHWDKEWYFTKEESEVLLVNNMKSVIETLNENKNYKTFNFDGQSSIIDEYLTYHPEDKSSISKLISERKLLVGPWYTQPDLYNVTSESIVRNLKLGIDVAKENGGEHLNLAYAPDSFGHNSQMPQIYNSFGLKDFIFWRGMDKKEYDEAGTLFNWKGIDGTDLRSYNFANGYWAMGSFFPYLMSDKDDLNELAKTFLTNSKEVVDNLKDKIKQKGILLLPLGGDQGPINSLTPKFFEFVNANSEDEWVLSNYEDFFKDLDKENISYVDVTEELKSPYIARIHKTIGSMRYDLKKLLKEVEYKMYQQLEPLASYIKINGGEYPFAIIRSALKNILISQAHDSAGGCNSDATNKNIENRLHQALDLIDSQITFCLRIISDNLNVKDDEFILFNTNANSKSRSHTVKLFTRMKSFEVFDAKNNKIDFELVESKFHSGGQAVKATAQGEVSFNLEGFSEYLISIEKEIDFGQPVKFKIVESKNSFNEFEIKNEKSISNKNISVSLKDNGTFEIISNANGKIEKAFELIATDDNGDSYDYSPFDFEPKIISELKSFSSETFENINTKKIIVKYIYQVPSSINSKELIEQPISLEVSIDSDEKIKLKINLKNKAKNIKWVINNNVGGKINNTLANQAFSTISRPTYLEEEKNWKEENWTEYPAAIETNESFVSTIGNNCQSISFFTNGNNEYEAREDTLSITLFRSVDVLGRHNLSWRPHRASGTSEFIVETPDAMLLEKDLEFNFMISLEKKINLWKEAKSFTTPTLFYQGQHLNNLFKKLDRFLLNNIKKLDLKNLDIEISNDNFVITTVKWADDNSGLIVRGFNSSTENINFKLFVNKKDQAFSKCSLQEIEISESIYKCELKSSEILTVKVKL